jgi:endo-1,4-beta-xylanase
MSRCHWLACGVILFWLLEAAPESVIPLRQAAEARGFLIGTAVRPSLFSEGAYSETLAREFNMIEPEDAMKWSVIRRQQGTFDFRDGDEIARFAEAHGMKVRGHCLVWDHDNPDWLVRGHFTPADLATLLQDHIRTVMGHYAGHVFAWDVINEALDENGRLRDSTWFNKPGIGFSENGWQYIEQVFQWAHRSDPHALLFYNEAEGEGLNRKSDAIYAMVKDFKQQGVPIDGVGMQMHLLLDFDTKAVAANIARLTALGVQVHITELDVSVPLDSSGQAKAEDLARQAEIYREIARACIQSSGCNAVQTWGFTDKYSWIGSHSHGSRGAALLFDRSYSPKPSYVTLRDVLLTAGSAKPGSAKR